MKKDHFEAAVVNICLKNTVVLVIFLVLSIIFKHWWIILISILFQTDVPHPISTIDPSPDSQFITCGLCGEILLVKDYQNVVHNEIKANNWERIPSSHGWVNVCPHCREEYSEEIEKILHSK